VAAPDFQIKAGDTSPAFTGKCLDANKVPVQTLGATVHFRMKPKVAGLRAALDQPATWLDPALAKAQYAWQTGDTAIPGLYDAEFHVNLRERARGDVPEWRVRLGGDPPPRLAAAHSVRYTPCPTKGASVNPAQKRFEKKFGPGRFGACRAARRCSWAAKTA